MRVASRRSRFSAMLIAMGLLCSPTHAAGLPDARATSPDPPGEQYAQVARARCRFPQMDFCRNRCGELKTIRCLPNGYWPPCPVDAAAHREVCDGRDNDCDGSVDEGELCADRYSCTEDFCGPDGFCHHRPHHERCDDGADCSLDYCDTYDRPPTSDEGFQLIDANGCMHLLRHPYCTDMDGCDCNGKETCAPGEAMPDLTPDARDRLRDFFAHGCRFSHRAQAPCEIDGNSCTLETCCEANPQCQFGALTGAFLTGCGLGATERDSETGARVKCPNGRRRYLPPPNDRVSCDDGNPCTRDRCIDFEGTCRNDVLTDGRQPGCDDFIEGGCSQHICSRGSCITMRHYRVPNPDDPSQWCHGQVYWQGTPTCRDHTCSDGRCVESGGLANRCDDHLQCNGYEYCAGIHNEFDAVSETTGILGCTRMRAPCDDQLNCTDDICRETRTGPPGCSNVPDHHDCIQANDRNPCNPAQYCDSAARSPGTGCVSRPLTTSICDDHNSSTVDGCSVDEFRVPVCVHQ